MNTVEAIESIYNNKLEAIKKTYQKSKDWGVVFATAVYSDERTSQEAFIDFVEETYKIKVKDAKHLQKLTEITHLDNKDSKTGKYITPGTEEEAKENAIRELEETLIGSRYNKYSNALEKALRDGAKYNDLLKIKPLDYGLPKTWSGTLAPDQYGSILWAINTAYILYETPLYLTGLPSLRAIAEEIEAPYSVLMDSYNLTK